MSFTCQFSEKLIKAKTVFKSEKLAPAFNEQDGMLVFLVCN